MRRVEFIASVGSALYGFPTENLRRDVGEKRKDDVHMADSPPPLILLNQKDIDSLRICYDRLTVKIERSLLDDNSLHQVRVYLISHLK